MVTSDGRSLHSTADIAVFRPLHCFEPFKDENVSDLKIQSVPRSKHSASVIKTDMLMLYREIIAVCSQIHAKHINTPCGQNTEFLNVKAGGMYSMS
jgi:hypothetical protein